VGVKASHRHPRWESHPKLEFSRLKIPSMVTRYSRPEVVIGWMEIVVELGVTCDCGAPSFESPILPGSPASVSLPVKSYLGPSFQLAGGEVTMGGPLLT
jgi:hypothetical protein